MISTLLYKTVIIMHTYIGFKVMIIQRTSNDLDATVDRDKDNKY